MTREFHGETVSMLVNFCERSTDPVAKALVGGEFPQALALGFRAISDEVPVMPTAL